MSNDFDFKPDWDAYHSMDDEERQARKELIKLSWRYNNDKISYEKYIGEIDNPYFYPYLSNSDFKEIENFNNTKKKDSESKKYDSYKTRQIKIRHKPTTSYYLFIFILIVSIIGFLIGISG